MSSDLKIALDLIKDYWVLIAGLGVAVITVAGWAGRLIERSWAKQDRESERQHDMTMAERQREHELQLLDRQATLFLLNNLQPCYKHNLLL